MVPSRDSLPAGRPVVPTPSRGGRDRYFPRGMALTAEPNPRAIREAVAALKARVEELARESAKPLFMMYVGGAAPQPGKPHMAGREGGVAA